MVTASHVTTGSDTANASPWSTASIAPAANRLVVVFATVAGTGTGGANISLSGLGLTWTQAYLDSAGRTTAVFWAITGSTAPTAGALTISTSTTGVTGAHWAVVQCAGYRTTNPLPQWAQSRVLNDTLTFATAPASDAGALAYGYDAPGVDITWTGGFTELGATTMATPTTWIEVDWAAVAPSSTTANWGSDNTGGSHIMMVEVANATISAVSPATRLTRWNVAVFPSRTFTGGLTPGAAVRRAGTKLVVGSAAPSGSVFRSGLNRRLAGALAPTAVTVKGGAYLQKKFTGTQASSGARTGILTRIKNISGGITPSGLTKKTLGKNLAGFSMPAGSGTGPLRGHPRRFSGVIETTGSLVTQFFHRLYGRAGTVDIHLADIGDLELQPYLRQRCDLSVWTVADVLYGDQYIWDSLGQPERPATAPLAPTAVTALAGFQQATVYFAAPRDDGGAPILDYTVTASTGQEAVGPVSPLVVSGLQNGAAVTFVVTARNERGYSPSSDPSAPVTPSGSLSDPPTGVTLTNGVSQQMTVSWVPPANSGGQPVLDYSISLSNGRTATATASPYTFTGLTNGEKVSAVVSTRTVTGTSRPSERSIEKIVGTTPGAPTITSWTAGNAAATVKWAAPASDGGAPIYRYVIRLYYNTSNITEQSATVHTILEGQPTNSPLEHTFTGLVNGDPYQVSVTAQNDVGTGPATRSGSVTPAAPVTTIIARTSKTVTTTGQSVIIPKPTGAVEGDLCVATVCHGELDNEITAPTGWTVVDYFAFADIQYGIYRRFLTASDASVTSWTWTITGPQTGQNTSAGMQAYDNVHPTVPIDGAVLYSEVSSGPITGSITTGAPGGGMLVGCLFTDGASSSTHPSGWVEDYDMALGARLSAQAHKTYSGASSFSAVWTPAASTVPSALVLFALRAA